MVARVRFPVGSPLFTKGNRINASVTFKSFKNWLVLKSGAKNSTDFNDVWGCLSDVNLAIHHTATDMLIRYDPAGGDTH